MITCKYCGQQLQFIGERVEEFYFDCTFCEMTFTLYETSAERKRKMSVPEYINIISTYATTKDFLACDTITLYYTLKDVRGFWYHLKSLLENSKIHITENQIPQSNDSDMEMDEVIRELKKEYMIITKKKFVIENIILERTGFLQNKITEDFLNDIYEQGKEASQKPMYVYIK